MYNDYLLNFHKTDIIKILEDEDTTKYFSININFIVLYEHHPDLVVDLLKEPEKCLEEWDRIAVKTQMVLLKEANDSSQLKTNVHCRMYQLPVSPDFRRTVFPGNDDAGKFIQVSGTVMRISAVKLLEHQRNYVCVTCKFSMMVKADYDRKYMIKQPKKCLNPEGCSSTNLVTFGELDSDNCKDYQEIKIQEQVKKLGVGCIPSTMWVTLEDDLVDICKPGDNVTICGIVKRRWGEFCKGNKIDIDIVLKANNVQVDNNISPAAAALPEVRQMFNSFWEKYSGNPLAGRDLILKSFCPQIYGLYLVKLAIAIVLAGGSRCENVALTGIRTRSESHLLLIGDPGTGKSQLLRFASKIIPRSVLTTGVGSTAAGLTVTAMMENGEWQLEGGALVLSDGGICCIDEFNSMKEHDRTSIHEAMEQQTISVAKASIVTKLNTRCSILAACNPKGNINIGQPLCMSVALPSPLLSRFDLILLLRDTVNQEWDMQVADYILHGGSNLSKLTESAFWTTDILQSYFSVIRKLHLRLSEDSETILSAYYQMQRRIDGRNKARTTVRLLESLVRLSQGHARLMYHEEVELMDSIYAIALVDVAMEDESSILDLNINTHSIFPECPLKEYRNLLETVLNKLGLHQILDKEIESLNKIKSNEFLENVKSRFFHKQDGDNGDKSFEVYGEIVGEVTGNSEQTLNDTENNSGNSKHNTRSPKISTNINKEVNRKKRAVQAIDDTDEFDITAPGSSNILKKDFNKNVTKRQKIGDAGKCVIPESENNLVEKVYDKKVKANDSEEISKAKKGFKIANDVLDFNFDEGYDTLCFDSSNTVKSRIDKNYIYKEIKVNDLKDRSTSNASKNNIGKRKNEESTSCFNSSSDILNVVSKQSSVSGKENSVQNIDTGELIIDKAADKINKTSIKDKLKKFKYALKDNVNTSKSDNKNDNGHPKLEDKNTEDKNMKEKLGVNNDSHQNVCLKSINKKKGNEETAQELPKPTSKFKFVKKLFDGRTSNDIVRNSSFELNRKIFQTSDEDIDMDLNV